MFECDLLCFCWRVGWWNKSRKERNEERKKREITSNLASSDLQASFVAWITVLHERRWCLTIYSVSMSVGVDAASLPLELVLQAVLLWGWVDISWQSNIASVLTLAVRIKAPRLQTTLCHALCTLLYSYVVQTFTSFQRHSQDTSTKGINDQLSRVYLLHSYQISRCYLHKSSFYPMPALVGVAKCYQIHSLEPTPTTETPCTKRPIKKLVA